MDESALNSGQGNKKHDWAAWGHDLRNTRNASGENKISPRNASRLTPKWEFQMLGDVSATPIVVDGSIYATDWGGGIFRIRENGTAVWSRKVSDYDGVPTSFTRGVAYSDNRLVFGTQPGLLRSYSAFASSGESPMTYPPDSARPELIVVDAKTGNLVWKRQVDEHFWATITGVPTIHDGKIYVATASHEENAAFFNGVTPTFRGSVSAFDLRTGERLWRRYLVPEGFAGGAVIGSGPAIDPKRGLLYIASNNGYRVPIEVENCAAAQTTPAGQEACLPPDYRIDSIMALDLRNGNIKWSRRFAEHYDVYTTSCSFGLCPGPHGNDTGFAQEPALIDLGGCDGELVGAGQKSGKYWALNPSNGATVWSRTVGPGGHVGGLQWGSATDDKRIYTANANMSALPHTLKNGQTVTSGSFAALEAKSGKILWQVPDPVGAKTWAPVSVANGVMYGCSGDAEGHMYAMDASSGAVLWTFPGGGPCLGGPTISNGNLYWGTGYAHFVIYPNQAAGPHKLYAFSVPGRN